MGHFMMQNGPFRSLKRAVLHYDSAHFATHYVSVYYKDIRIHGND